MHPKMPALAELILWDCVFVWKWGSRGWKGRESTFSSDKTDKKKKNPELGRIELMGAGRFLLWDG